MPPFSWCFSAYTLRRYQGLIAAMVLGFATLGGIAGSLRPRAYLGDVVVQVEPQQVPDRLVAAPVGGAWQARLAALNQQLLTAASLQRVMRQFRLFPSERRRLPADAVLDQMRRRIEVRLDRNWLHDAPGAFHVTFEHADPVLAAAVANHLARLLIELNVRGRGSSVTGAFDFLDQQLAWGRLELARQDARLTRYRLAHSGEIPGQEAVLIAAVNRLQLEWQSTQERLARVEQSRAALSDALYAAQSAPPQAEQVDGPAVERLRRQLDALRSRYSDRHPEVRLLRDEAAAAQALQAPRQSSNAMPLRQRLEALSARLQSAGDEQTWLVAQSAALLLRIAAYQNRLEQSPLHEVQWNSLTSDHATARLNYLSLLEKRTAAQLSADLERRQKDETFRILEPARVPLQPKGLDWPSFALLGWLVGAMAGIAAAFACDARRDVVQGAWELPPGVGLLGRVPILSLPPQRAPRSVRDLRASAAASMALLALFFRTGR